MSAIPPATLEGWYALHQAVTVDWKSLRALEPADRAAVASEARALFAALSEPVDGAGWSAAYQLVGGGADWLFVHFRETLDALAEVELQLRRSPFWDFLQLEYDFTSVTEAGLYHATAQAAREAEPRTAEFERLVAEAAEAERASPHLQTRLFPRVPDGMRFVCFYPMTKRRAGGDNWYALPVDERNRMMREHGLSGRRYAGKVFQVITGATGLDDWEWGVTLYAKDPLEFKRIVTELRYDEASARYGEFGSFFTGVETPVERWPEMLGAA